MKRPADLSEPLSRRLNSYSLAASAAGVSLLALAQAAEAKIVYTPRHDAITCNQSAVWFDLNHDGTTDFWIGQYSTSSKPGTAKACWLVASGLGSGDRIAGNQRRSHFYSASALKAGTKIGRKSKFPNQSGAWFLAAAKCSSSGNDLKCFSSGPWAGVGTRYLGLEFTIKGKTHYGWARLHVAPTKGKANVNATLTGYAYETVPNRPIITGKTKGPDVITLRGTSLGDLARGAAAIPAWRHRETQ